MGGVYRAFGSNPQSASGTLTAIGAVLAFTFAVFLAVARVR
jgi:hypothetical protein